METNANLYKHEHSFLEPMSFIPITNSTTNHPLLENLTEGKTSEKVSKRDWLLITIASDINKELPRWNRHSITLVSKLQDSGQALSLCPSVHPCRAGTGTPAPRGGGGICQAHGSTAAVFREFRFRKAEIQMKAHLMFPPEVLCSTPLPSKDSD